MPGSPTLTLDLTELVLMHAAHLVHTHSLQNPEPVARVLNAAARSEVPNVTKRVLWDFSWITADTACKFGDIGLLKLLVDWSNTIPHDGGSSVRRPLEMTIKGIDSASANGHVHVLEYLFGPDSRLQDLEWSVAAMDEASANGHIACLDWWLRSGKELKYSERAMDAASANSDFPVLNWWRKHVNQPLASNEAMRVAAENGRMDVLEWFMQTDVGFNALVPAGAAKSGHLHVLQWFEHAGRFPGGMDPGYDYMLGENTRMLMSAIQHGQDGVILWCHLKRKHFLSESSRDPHEEYEFSGDVSLTTIAVEYGNLAALIWLDAVKRLHVQRKHIPLACKTGNVHVLAFVAKQAAGDMSVSEFLSTSGYQWPLQVCLKSCYVIATERGDCALLDWLLENKLRIDASVDYFTIASRAGSEDVLKWWNEKYPGPTKLNTTTAFVEASKQAHLKVLDWWQQEGWIRPANMDLNTVLCNSSRSSLEWWFTALGNPAFHSVGALKYTEVSSVFDQIDSLDWWTARGYLFETTQALVDDCTRKCKLSLLEWLHKWTKGSLACTELQLGGLDTRQQALVVDWWASHGYALQTVQVTLSFQQSVPFPLLAKLQHVGVSINVSTPIDLDILSANGDVRGLQYVCQTDWTVVYTPASLRVATQNSLLSVLEWWLRAKLPVKLPVAESELTIWIMDIRFDEARRWWKVNQGEMKVRAAVE